ncbi:MAG: hypothetical protein WC006_01290 [Bacilli bacterium]|nr:hypothetical protein [Bacilli bacterium]
MNKNYRLITKIEGIKELNCLNDISKKLKELGAINVIFEYSLDIINIDYIGNEEEANKYYLALAELGYTLDRLAVFNLDEVYS